MEKRFIKQKHQLKKEYPMKLNWKLLTCFLIASLLSAGIGIGTYHYLSTKNKTSYSSSDTSFDQTGFLPVNYSLPPELDFTKAAERSVHAVVHIKSTAKSGRSQGYVDPYEWLFGYSQPRVGFGSGVIISRDGYIITNNHVIAGADEIEVTTNEGDIYTAELIGRDETTDLALLKIEGEDFELIPFGDSDKLKIGEWVLAIGNPFNLTSTVTSGIVSAKERGNIMDDPYRNSNRVQDKIQSYIQTDAAVNPGNSGGALVNTRGELVGINTAIYSETGNFVGYSFAIPINIAKKVVTDLKEHGTVQRALLGIIVSELPALKEKDPDTYDKLKVKDGVYIDSFSSKSSAESAGIKEGDVIISINGHRVKNYTELKAQLARYNPGDKIHVGINRKGEELSYEVKLTNNQGTTDVIKAVKATDVLGAELKTLSDKNRSKLRINYGVEVSSLKNGKLKDLGIEEGFIILTLNRSKVYSPNDVESIIGSIMKQDNDDRGLFVRGCYSDGKIIYFAIDLSN